MHPDLAAIAAQGWNVEETTDRRGLTYYEARRGGYERGAYTPAMLRELCEAAPRGAVRQVPLWAEMKEAA
jgi:hypothetical protein